MTMITNLQDLFVDELSDMINAEKQIVEALPKMAENCNNQELAQNFRQHLEETQNQIDRLDRVCELCDLQPEENICEAMEGLVEECEELISNIEDKEVLDAALITAAQKVEHYEIAAYGSLCALARTLGYDQEAIQYLEDNLQEEKEADKKLTQMAEQGGINQQAMKQAA